MLPLSTSLPSPNAISAESLQGSKQYYLVQSGTAYTEPGPLERGCNSVQAKTPCKSVQQAPSPRRPAQTSGNTKFTNHRELQNFSSWGKQYTAFVVFSYYSLVFPFYIFSFQLVYFINSFFKSFLFLFLHLHYIFFSFFVSLYSILFLYIVFLSFLF